MFSNCGGLCNMFVLCVSSISKTPRPGGRFINDRIASFAALKSIIASVVARASADLLRDFLKFLALVRHRTMLGRVPYGAPTVPVGIVLFQF